MAMLKYADAIIKSPSVEPKTWNKIRHAATPVTAVPVQSIIQDFAPDKYLLTHCTIVASVDVESNGYYIKPECSQYVNQNGDSWERRLLLSTFNTFIGAQNYLEHVQIPVLSKGRIIDAVARPVADNTSVYIDILVATERKHRDLIASIENGDLKTLSMGCSIKYSFCTKCGNKAADETELCDHVKYMKGQYFVDENGVKRIIAELCGHHEDPSSNIFIEASWVKTPAFKGAVLRNILIVDDKEDQEKVAKQVEKAFTVKRQENHLDGYLKAAKLDQLSSLKKKVDALVASKEILKKAGIDPFDDIPESEVEPSDEEQVAPEGELSEEAAPQEAAPQESAPQEAAPQEAAPQEAAPQIEGDGLPNLDQVKNMGGEQGQGTPDPHEPTDSFDSLVDEVKKNIRQQVIDELQKELGEQQNKDQELKENTKINQGWNTNENLVKAFVELYKPPTGFSDSKLASIFKMIVAGENGEDFRKYARSNRDIIDFLEFTDRFQLIKNSLNKRDYDLLRKASHEDLVSLDSFVEFLNKNSITNKQVIKRIVAKARFLKR